jgi:uncharacterized protein YbjT (DUF2867 family)
LLSPAPALANILRVRGTQSLQPEADGISRLLSANELKDPLTKAGIYPMPLGDVGVSAVDIRDIAEATAIVLTLEEHYGKTYNLNGPEALSGPKAASIWSKLLGKEIRYGGDDMDAFEEQVRKRAPSWSPFDLRIMFEAYLERGFVAEDEDLETLTKLLGHTPRRYEDFAKETALSWQKQQAMAKPAA